MLAASLLLVAWTCGRSCMHHPSRFFPPSLVSLYLAGSPQTALIPFPQALHPRPSGAAASSSPLKLDVSVKESYRSLPQLGPHNLIIHLLIHIPHNLPGHCLARTHEPHQIFAIQQVKHRPANIGILDESSERAGVGCRGGRAESLAFGLFRVGARAAGGSWVKRRRKGWS